MARRFVATRMRDSQTGEAAAASTPVAAATAYAVTPIRRRQQMRCLSGESARWSVGGVGEETDAGRSRCRKSGGACRRREKHKRLQCRCRDDAACGGRGAGSSRRFGRVGTGRRGAAFHCSVLRAGDQHHVLVAIDGGAGDCPVRRLRCGHGHAAAEGHGSPCITAKGKRQHDCPDERRSQCAIHSAGL